MPNGTTGLLPFPYYTPQICSSSSPFISVSTTSISLVAQVEYVCHIWLFLLLHPLYQIHQLGLSLSMSYTDHKHSSYTDEVLVQDSIIFLLGFQYKEKIPCLLLNKNRYITKLYYKLKIGIWERSLIYVFNGMYILFLFFFLIINKIF